MSLGKQNAKPHQHQQLFTDRYHEIVHNLYNHLPANFSISVTID